MVKHGLSMVLTPGSGSFQQVIRDTVNISKGTVCPGITRVPQVLLKEQKETIFWPTQEERAKIAAKLHRDHNSPYAEGMIDGMHIKIPRRHM